MKITRPKLRITSKGIKIQAPRARIGNKTGLNISKSGVSGSVRTKFGTYNTRKGCSLLLVLFTGLGALALLA